MQTIVISTIATKQNEPKTNYCKSRVMPLKLVVIVKMLPPCQNVNNHNRFELPANQSGSERVYELVKHYGYDCIVVASIEKLKLDNLKLIQKLIDALNTL